MAVSPGASLPLDNLKPNDTLALIHLMLKRGIPIHNDDDRLKKLADTLTFVGQTFSDELAQDMQQLAKLLREGQDRWLGTPSLFSTEELLPVLKEILSKRGIAVDSDRYQKLVELLQYIGRNFEGDLADDLQQLAEILSDVYSIRSDRGFV